MAHLQILVKLAMQVRPLQYTTPSVLIALCHTALADADPLGVNQNVTFDEVGGLDDREQHQDTVTIFTF